MIPAILGEGLLDDANRFTPTVPASKGAGYYSIQDDNMIKTLVRFNEKISHGFEKVQWLFYVAIGSGAVSYALNFVHLAILGIASPFLLVAILYVVGDQHKRHSKGL